MLNRRRVVASKGGESPRDKDNNNLDDLANKAYRKQVSSTRLSQKLACKRWCTLIMCLLVIATLWKVTKKWKQHSSSVTRIDSLSWSEVPQSNFTPRMLQLNEDDLRMDDTTTTTTMTTTTKIVRIPLQWELPPPQVLRRNEYWDNNRVSDLKMPDDLRTRDTCKYESDWQFSYHPSCNSLHEIALNDLGNGDIKLVNNGAFRDVWRIKEHDGAYRVMKTLRLIDKRKFDQRNFDRHRRDALAFEQLKPSPYVVDIYGHCSNSAVFDYCDGGDLYKLHWPNGRDTRTGESLEGEEVNLEDKPSPKKILEVAIIVAKSVADAHNFDNKGRPTIAHTDIKPDQWIMGSDGNYRLNDFNRGRFLSWDTKRDEVCPFTVGKNPGLWRSPEEYNYQDQTEKGDVWSLGNVLYFLLTGDTPYSTIDYKVAIEYVQEGGRPEVDPVLASSTDPYQIALFRAMDECFVVDPKRRLSARKIAQNLEAVLLGAANGGV